jgi:hypothetical protein
VEALEKAQYLEQSKKTFDPDSYQATMDQIEDA